MTMIRPLSSLIILNFVLLVFVLTATRAQSSDDMRNVLFASECAPPCFLGIRPGVTTRDEALAILQTHPWVERVTTPAATDKIYWTWNRSQPAFLMNHELRNTISFLDGVSSKIDLTVDGGLGSVLVTFGMPDAWKAVPLNQYYSPTAVMEETFVVLLAYHAYPVQATVTGLCTFGFVARETQYARIVLSQVEDSAGIANVERAPLMRMALTDSCS